MHIPAPSAVFCNEVMRFSVPLSNVLPRIQQTISFQDEGRKLKWSESIKHFLSSDNKNELMAKVCFQNVLTLQVMALK